MLKDSVGKVIDLECACLLLGLGTIDPANVDDSQLLLAALFEISRCGK